MTATIDDLLSAFCDEIDQTRLRYSPFIQRAEAGGYPQLAKLFRAVIASETVRGKHIRTGMAHHARDELDFYVCPHCGLIFIPEAPEKCPVDDTPGAQFEQIS